MIILFQFEQCPDTFAVRRKLTARAIDFIVVNAPPGHPEKDDVMMKLFGSAEVPALWDTRTGALIQGERECEDYVVKMA